MNPRRQKLIDEIVAMGYLKTPRIIEAFKTIDRKDFVLSEYEGEAYGNYPLPIGQGQTISQPLTVAFMLELLQPAPGEKIMDVGHGSGWTSTLLAEIIGGEGTVFAVERIPELCEFGKKNIAKYGFIKKGVVKTICGDAALGIPEEAPFDKIIAAAAAPAGRAALQNIPKAWREELKVGGIIVSPIGGSIWRFTKKSDDKWLEEEFPGFAFVPLVNDNQQPYRAELSGFRPITNHSPQKPSVSIGRPIVTVKKTASEELSGKKRRQEPNIHKGLWLPVIFLFASCFLSYLAYATFAPIKFESKKIKINIEEGTGLERIADLVKEKKLVRSKWLFVNWALLSNKAFRLKAGNYNFENSTTIPEIVKRLASGEQFPNERIITIPEGWNIYDIAEYLELNGVITAEDFLAITGSAKLHPAETVKKLSVRFPFLQERPRLLGLEGYLFPDTYRIFHDTAAEDIAVKMLENFQKKITPELLAEINRQKKTLFQVITMASLIEKEVPHNEDRAVVSGILWKRFELGMGLQVDASITYIKQQDTNGKEQRARISIEDTKIDSLYNTYQYRGLPIGPISNPSLSAIRAAIFPKSSPYLYYLSTPEGKTIFSETLEEHNAAKAKYLK